MLVILTFFSVQGLGTWHHGWLCLGGFGAADWAWCFFLSSFGANIGPTDRSPGRQHQKPVRNDGQICEVKWVSRTVIDIPDLEMEACERHTCLKLVTMGCSLLDAMLFRCRFVTSVVALKCQESNPHFHICAKYMHNMKPDFVDRYIYIWIIIIINNNDNNNSHHHHRPHMVFASKFDLRSIEPKRLWLIKARHLVEWWW